MIRALVLSAVLVVSAALLGGCASGTGSATPATPSVALGSAASSLGPGSSGTPTTEANVSNSPASGGSFTLTSSAFSPGGAIPRTYSCDGEGRSVPLEWSDVPSGTAELALLVDDPDAGGFVHWVAAGIPPTASGLAEGASGSKDVPIEGRNGAGRNGWTGPCPPSGTHHYDFALFAVSKPLGLKPGATADELRAAVKDVTIGTAKLVGTYQRS